MCKDKEDQLEVKYSDSPTRWMKGKLDKSKPSKDEVVEGLDNILLMPIKVARWRDGLAKRILYRFAIFIAAASIVYLFRSQLFSTIDRAVYTLQFSPKSEENIAAATDWVLETFNKEVEAEIGYPNTCMLDNIRIMYIDPFDGLRGEMNPDFYLYEVTADVTSVNFNYSISFVLSYWYSEDYWSVRKLVKISKDKKWIESTGLVITESEWLEATH